MAQRRRQWGSGSIVELVPGKKFRIIAPAGWDPVSGARRQPSRTVHGTRTDAQRALHELMLEASTRRDVSAVTVRHAVERMLREAPLAATTRDDYRRAADRIVLPLLGSVPLDKLETSTIHDAWQAALRDHSRFRVARAHTVLSATCRWCLRWGWLRGGNPAHGASVTEPPRPDREAVSGEVLSGLLDAVAGDPELSIWLLLAITTGGRRGEILGLQWADIDIEGRSIAIRRAVAYTPSAGLHVKPTKTGKPRLVALDEDTMQALEHFRARPGQPSRPNDHILTSGDGAPWRPDFATYRFGRIRATVPGAEVIRLHELRSAAATHLLAAGHDLATVAKRLGHARPSITLERYARSLPESQRATAVTMREIIGHRTE